MQRQEFTNIVSPLVENVREEMLGPLSAQLLYWGSFGPHRFRTPECHCRRIDRMADRCGGNDKNYFRCCKSNLKLSRTCLFLEATSFWDFRLRKTREIASLLSSTRKCVTVLTCFRRYSALVHNAKPPHLGSCGLTETSMEPGSSHLRTKFKKGENIIR